MRLGFDAYAYAATQEQNVYKEKAQRKNEEESLKWSVAWQRASAALRVN